MADPGAASGQGREVDVFTDADIEILSDAPLLRELSDEDSNILRPHVHVVLLRKGERLYEEGAVDDKLYAVIAGKVKLTRTSSDGREVLVRVQGPGEMFGELAMFDPEYRTSTAAAITDARLAVIAHDDLRDVLLARPSMAMLLLKELAQRLRNLTETTTGLIFTDVPGRVARALLDLADKFGTEQDDGIQVNHDLTQEELAQYVGASRETVNKALADFANRGWLQLSAKSVVLIDPERLRRRAR
jgi:CRP/FNR family transcriptional regulator